MKLHPSILILDFGGQYTQLICRRIRELGVYSEIRPYHTPAGEIENLSPLGIILSGGPESVFLEESPKPDPGIMGLEVPILGICYGMQWLHFHFGGTFLSADKGEYGAQKMEIHPESRLLRNLGSELRVWMSHGDSVDPQAMETSARITARTGQCVAAVEWTQHQAYGVQFHPEVSHCEGGNQILENFTLEICRCERNWSMAAYLDETRKSISSEFKNSKVLSFVSGGVDSTFVTVLLASIPGVEVFAVYIDALMRKGETEEVVELLEHSGIRNLTIIRAQERFLKALEGLVEPEAKRKAVGELFGKLQQEACDSLGLDPHDTLLAQGTLYTDLIESGKGVGKKAHVIKSHHNVGCEFIERLKERSQIIEPARSIFKDEVRAAAAELGLPEKIVRRQPFPGPGMAIRIVSSNPDWIDDEFIENHGRLDRFCQNFGCRGSLLPVKTVGVQGDQRTYRFAAMIQGSRDWDCLSRLASDIPSEFSFINRVVFESEEEPGEPLLCASIPQTRVDKTHLQLLQDIDAFGREFLSQRRFEKGISQTIFVLIGADPFHTGRPGVVLRAVSTQDFMTVSPVRLLLERELSSGRNGEISWECFLELRREILSRFSIGAFFLDLSEKPPATTCWE